MKVIAAALVQAQKAFGPALKTQQNTHFKNKYADLASCIDAVIQALHDNDIALIQRTIPDDSGIIVETVFLHSSGEEYSAGRLAVPAVKNDPQGYGSALTYARRYSLMSACGMAPEDDDGEAARLAAQKAADITAAAHRLSIQKAADLESLKAEFGAAYTWANRLKREADLSAFKSLYEDRKLQLNQDNKEAA